MRTKLILMAALALLGACAPRLPVEKPVRVFDMQQDLEIVVTSEPSGASVFAIDDQDKPSESLGVTPLSLTTLSLSKEFWKYSEASPPPEPEHHLAALEEAPNREEDARRRSHGEGYVRALWLTAEGHRPTRMEVRLTPQDLPAAFREGSWVTHVVLEPQPPGTMSELKSARGDELLRLLLSSPPDRLMEALDNEALGEEQLVATLRRRDLRPEFMNAIARDTSWPSKYLVKVVLVMNPRTPKVHAMNYVKFLFWRDLVKVLNNYALDPPVRVTADKVLRDRLDEMELGEKIALARIGSKEVVKMLRRTRDRHVFGALLLNPRLTEDDLLPVTTDSRTPPDQLRMIATHPRWAARYALRLALTRNPSTPPHIALSQLSQLTTRDCRDLQDNPNVPRLVRLAAERLKRDQQRRGARGETPG